MMMMSNFLQPATWRTMFHERRIARSLRRLADAQIVRHFTGRVRFAEVETPLLRYVLNPLLAAYWALARLLIVW